MTPTFQAHRDGSPWVGPGLRSDPPHERAPSLPGRQPFRPLDSGDMSPKAIRANQESFDLLAGDIFARLYTHFPEPINIQSDGIFYNDALKKLEGFDDDPERLQVLYGHAVRWLANEGFLRFG